MDRSKSEHHLLLPHLAALRAHVSLKQRLQSCIRFKGIFLWYVSQPSSPGQGPTERKSALPWHIKGKYTAQKSCLHLGANMC